MDADIQAFGSFSVDNLQDAKKFYGQTLGLNVTENKEMNGILDLRMQGTTFVIYLKPDHTPATFTVLNFRVKDIEKTVDELTANGVKFEHYEEPIRTDEKGIFRGEGPLIAWFKDPAGNILSVIEEEGDGTE